MYKHERFCSKSFAEHDSEKKPWQPEPTKNLYYSFQKGTSTSIDTARTTNVSWWRVTDEWWECVEYLPHSFVSGIMEKGLGLLLLIYAMQEFTHRLRGHCSQSALPKHVRFVYNIGRYILCFILHYLLLMNFAKMYKENYMFLPILFNLIVNLFLRNILIAIDKET